MAGLFAAEHNAANYASPNGQRQADHRHRADVTLASFSVQRFFKQEFYDDAVALKSKNLEGFVCGPECMIHEIQRMTTNIEHNWQASLEERMACGVGVCLGCAVSIKNQGWQMVCKDGPVFNLKEINFND